MVYLICFERPYKRVRHYAGSTNNLTQRMKEHARGKGARLMEVITEAGIRWQLVSVWTGGRKEERAFKNQKNAASMCPLCRPAYLERRNAQARTRYARSLEQQQAELKEAA